MVDGGTTITVPMSRVEEVGEDILTYLAEKEVPVGFAQLGCALVIGRLSCPETDLPTQEQERDFVEHLTEWVNLYWGAGPSSAIN
jgi:hypothetical protein